MPLDDHSGQVVKGYQLVERIGAGGFGTVYRADQKSVDREVAVKIILPQYANHPDFIRRFEAEAQLVARLEHPFIVPLYDYWREPNNAYLVMRYLRGGSLQSLIEEGGALPLEVVANILDQIGAALSLAHRNGVIHRDLKPENILLDQDGNAYLTDFGIAKDVKSSETLNTQAGSIVGSPMYLSPEQIKGDQVTSSADIYSLGVVLYEMLCGERPFPGSSMPSLLVKHLNEPLPYVRAIVSDISPAVDAVIQRATAKDSTHRFSNTIAMAAAFRRAMGAPIQDGAGADLTGEIHRSAIYTAAKTPSHELPDPVNPYKGLRSFQEADAADYFGRDSLIQVLVDHLAKPEVPHSQLLVLIGPSGSGKSSAVRAGLIPALRNDALPGSSRWFVTEMTPGSQPMEELEAALLRVAVNPPESLLTQLREDERGLLRAVKRVLPSDNGIELVLYVDQFEELFTQTEDEARRRMFLAALAEAASDTRGRLRIIISLRADFYDRPLMYPDFGLLVRECTEVVLPLSRGELRQAIVGPAERVGVTIEPELVSRIIADVSEQPGMLPLLQYALTELFELREAHVLKLGAYTDRGGVRGALARRAEELYSEFDEDSQEAVRQLFLRLVTPGEGVDDTRRRVLRSEVASLGGDVLNVVAQYGGARLLTFDRDSETREPTVEIAHEALIREWQHLRQWLDSSRDDLRMQRRIAQSAAEWMNSGRDDSYLATGFRFQQFNRWRQDTDFSLNLEEESYLDASTERLKRQEEEEAARLEREQLLERRSRHVLIALVVLAGVAALISLGLAGVARSAQVRAELGQIQNQSLNLATGAQLALADADTDEAIVLALAATSIEDPPTQAVRSLAEAVLAPGTRHLYVLHEGNINSVEFNFDGNRILTGADDGQVLLRDRRTGSIVFRLNGHTGPIRRVAFNDRGNFAASGSDDGRMIVWDLRDGSERFVYEDHDGPVLSVGFGPQSELVASASADGTVNIYDVQTGELVQTLDDGHDGAVTDLVFTPDGDFIITSGEDSDMIRWEISTGALVRRYIGHAGRINAIDISEDGTLLASAAATDNAVFIWDARTGAILRRLTGHADQPWDVAFSPTSSLLVTGSQDGSVRVWDSETGTEQLRFLGHGSGVTAVDFSPDGLNLLSGAQNSETRLWDIKNGAELSRYTDHQEPVYSVDYSPDGRLAVSGSWDTTLRIWDVQTNRSLRTLGAVDNVDPDVGHTDWVVEVDFTSDGKRVLSSSYDGTLILWDVQTGEIIRRFDHGVKLWSSAISADERLAASGADDGSLKVWDVQTGELLAELEGHDGPIRAMDINPDSTLLLTGAGIDQTVREWSLETFELIQVLEGHEEWLWHIQYLPDGTQALSSSSDGVILLWDLRSGEVIRTFIGHDGPVVNFDIWPDGSQMITSSSDTTIRTWDIETGRELRRFSGHTSTVWSVSLSPDGERVLSGSGDSTVRLWDVTYSLDQLIEFAQENRYIRELNCVEAAEYEIDLEACE